MSIELAQSVIDYPVQACVLFRYGSAGMIVDYAYDQVLSVSGTLAAGATVNLIAAEAGLKRRIGKFLFNVDLGGPYLFSFGGAISYRMRLTGPFVLGLDFSPRGLLGNINTATTLKNEHATVAGNYEGLLFTQTDY